MFVRVFVRVFVPVFVCVFVRVSSSPFVSGNYFTVRLMAGMLALSEGMRSGRNRHTT